ncbi:LysR family transcriptional regulator [Cupriavidus respiraculi]|uniref:LysR family transcriptional regulator n=1 Tax=Cupriavidus respiraculi TaxID=195930 RepID=UPI001C98AACC|nr:LysR family transcriptional regulator [Cupriavidus respiraculi]MBY4945585.1 LysR family transcriptional regulator [Cupriavidus respiraculi]
MQLARIDLNLFVVFDAIYTEGSITAAARQLNLTQPAVSHALGRLRTLFDDPLFERRGQGMAPTPLARSLAGEVRTALQSFARTLQDTPHFEPGATVRRFTIGMRDALESTLLPPLMSRVAAVAPQVDIAAVRFDRREMESELLAGTLDTAIDILLPVSPAIHHAPFMADPMVVLARKDHPLIRKELTLDRYLAAEHVHVSSRRRGAGLEDQALHRMGLTRRVRLRCQHYAAACRVVSCTDLLATLPLRYARIANEAYGNRLLSLPFKVPTLELHLYWHAGGENDGANRWLREQLGEVIGGLDRGAAETAA